MDIKIYHARPVRLALGWNAAAAAVALARGEYYLAGKVRVEATSRERGLAGAWVASQTGSTPWAAGQRTTLPGDLFGLSNRLWLVRAPDRWVTLPLRVSAEHLPSDSFEAFHAKRPVMLDCVDRESTEWGVMWTTLANRYGDDPVCMDPATGESWQYHGTWCDVHGIWHTFRHRSFPGLGQQRVERIRASTLYRPRGVAQSETPLPEHGQRT